MAKYQAKRKICTEDEEFVVEAEQEVIAVKSSVEEGMLRYVHPNPRAFKGRLGYACMNTLLRKQKPSVFSARTCRLDTFSKKGFDHVKQLALSNVADMKTMIQWNEDNKIRFMRLSSDMFPFASHEKVGYEIDFAKKELAEAGALANKYKHRLTMHPGQYNQLVSLTPKVVSNTVRELHYHAHMMDLMELDQDSVMIIHMGGVYGDREAALARFELEYNKLPENIKRRLVLENDEMGYAISDLLPICKKLQVPLVLDWHHHHLNPGTTSDLVTVLPEINKTWTDKGIKPKQHYSESRSGALSLMEKRAHSDRVQNLPPTTDDVDLMIEAKDKEQAVFQLYKLYDLETVNNDVWTPQTGIESTQTNGRKSTKSQKAKKRKAMKKDEELTVEEVTEVRQTTSRSTRLANKQSNKIKEEQKGLEEVHSVQKVSARKPITKRTKKAAESEDELLSPSEREKVSRMSRKMTIEQNNDTSFNMESGSLDDIPEAKKDNKHMNSITPVNGKSRRTVGARKSTRN